MAAERTVVVRLIGMVGQYRAAMAESAAATRALDSQMLATSRVAANATRGLAASQQAALGGMASTMRSMRGMMLGLGVPLAIGAMAKSFFEFEQQMAHTKAVADSFGQSATGFKALSDAALTMGQRFGFSAVEVGQAQEALVKAGRTTAQVLGGELSSALTLAAAGTIGLEEAARISAVTMTVFKDEFKLTGETAQQAADTMVGAANVTVSGVQEMGNALSYVGPLAASLGVSFKDTVATISVFNQAGIEGERAGTNLRGMLTNLLSPSAMARKEMIRLGVDLFNASGEFVGMSEAAQILHDKVGSLGGRDQAEAVGRLTTNASMPGFITLMKLGAAGVDEMKRKIAESATAEEVAAQKLDSVTGEFKKLGAAVEAASIKVGATMAPALGDLAKGLTTATQGFGNLGGASQLALLALGAQLLMARRVHGSFQNMSGSIGTATKAYRDLALMQQRGGIAQRGFIGPLLPTAPGASAPLLRAAAETKGLSAGIGRLRGEWQAATTAAGRFGAAGSAAVRGVGGAVSGLTSFLGGPLGVALAGATVGFAVWQARVAEGKRITESFRSGLAQLGQEYATTGEVSDASARSMFRNNAEMQWLISNSQTLGLSLDTVTLAATGQRDAVRSVAHELDVYAKNVKAVRERISVGSAQISTRGRVSEADRAELARLNIKPKTASWYNTESAATIDRLKAVEQQTEAVRKEFERTHQAEAMLMKAMADRDAAQAADQMKALGIELTASTVAIDAMVTNLATMNSAEAEFSDRINAMTSNVSMLATAFHSVADAQAAFFAASQEGLASAFREDVETLTGGGGGGGARKYGVTTTTEESASQRITAGKAAQDRVQVIKGGRPPKTPVPDKVSTTQNPDGTTTTVTTKIAADGTKTITTHRSGIAAGQERERTRQRVTTDRRPDGTTITTTTTTDAAGNKTVDTRKTHDPDDARKAAEGKKPTPTRYVAPKVDEVTGQLDVTTATGRKQHAALVGMADATAKTVADTFTQVAMAGKNTGEAMEFAGVVATAAFMKQRDEAMKALVAVGMNKDMAKQLVEAYYALPAELSTRINAQGAEETLEVLKGMGVEMVTLSNGRVVITADSKGAADKLHALGGTITRLPSGRFKVTFANQAQMSRALNKLAEDRVVTLTAKAERDAAEAELKNAARNRTARIFADADRKSLEFLGGELDGLTKPRMVPIIAMGFGVGGKMDATAPKPGLDYFGNPLPTAKAPAPGRFNFPVPSAGPAPWNWVTPRRWGGFHEARNGLLSGAQLGTSGPLYQWAEPATGGEAFIPRRGQRGRSMAILDKAASWYGASVQSGPAWKGANLSKAAPGQVQITVRGEGVLSGMIEATVDGRLVKVAQAVSNGRVR